MKISGFLQMFWKDGLSKEAAPKYDIYCITMYFLLLFLVLKTSKPYYENRVCTFTRKLYSHWSYINVNKLNKMQPVMLNNKLLEFLRRYNYRSVEVILKSSKLHSCQYEKLFLYFNPNKNCRNIACCIFRFVFHF